MVFQDGRYTVAIIEVSQPNHYSAVNGLAKAYATDPCCDITIVTLPAIAGALRECGIPKGLSLLQVETADDVDGVLERLGSGRFDRMHLCTVEGSFERYGALLACAQQVALHIHNIDSWFGDSWGRCVARCICDCRALKSWYRRLRRGARLVREMLFELPARRRLLDNVMAKSHAFFVISSGQRELLADLVPHSRIVQFPFALHEAIPEIRSRDTRLRVCVPGVISSQRRDYAGLMALLLARQESFRGRVSVDLLGYFPSEDRDLVERFREVAAHGIEVTFETEPIYGAEFDRRLFQADLIVNNLKTDLGAGRRYGVTKESGIAYSMIRAGKPGLAPEGYRIEPELEEVTWVYESWAVFGDILEGFLKSPESLDELKSRARQISQEHFSPPMLCERLKY